MSLQQIPGHYIVSATSTATGGGATLYNTSVTATSTASATGEYTATQVPVSAKDNVTASPTGTTSQYVQWNACFYAQMFDWSEVSSLGTLFVGIPMNYDVGQYTAFIGTGTSFSLATYTDRVTNGYLAVQYGSFDLGVSATVDSYLWEELGYYAPSTVFVGFGSYQMQQEYTGVLNSWFTGQVTTGTAYPFPDKPITDYFSATGRATAYEYIASSYEGYKPSVSGSATNGTSTLPLYGTGNVGFSVPSLRNALSAILGTAKVNSTYPASAYSITGSTGSITSGSTGLGL